MNLVSMLEKEESKFEKSLNGIRQALRAIKGTVDGRAFNRRQTGRRVAQNPKSVLEVPVKRTMSEATRRKISRTQRKHWKAKHAAEGIKK